MFKIFKRNKKEKKDMKHFSDEYREKLQNEHKLVSASITHLTTSGWPRFARAHGADVVTAAVSNLKVRKVELEAQIDVLTEFLDG